MRNYCPSKYIELVENSEVPMLMRFMNQELEFLKKVVGNKNKAIIDLGAGYGRIIPFINDSLSYYGIEINPEMFDVLQKRAKSRKNIFVGNGDITKLTEFINEYQLPKNNVIFTLLQNTVGTIEGDLTSLVYEIKNVLREPSNELIISFFRVGALRKDGINMFKSLSSMVGEPDFSKTNFKSGLFVSNTGYEAKWWSDVEINQFIDNFNPKIVSVVKRNEYFICHLIGKA